MHFHRNMLASGYMLNAWYICKIDMMECRCYSLLLGYMLAGAAACS